MFFGLGINLFNDSGDSSSFIVIADGPTFPAVAF